MSRNTFVDRNSTITIEFLITLIQGKYTLNDMLKAYVLIKNNRSSLDLKALTKQISLSKYNSQNDKYVFVATTHFYSKIIERGFDICENLIQIYLYAVENGECYRKELFCGNTTVCFTVEKNRIQLITGWVGQRKK